MYYCEWTNICPLSIASGKPQNCKDECLLKDKGTCLLVEYLKKKANQL